MISMHPRHTCYDTTLAIQAMPALTTSGAWLILLHDVTHHSPCPLPPMIYTTLTCSTLLVWVALCWVVVVCAHIHIAVFVRRKTWSRFLARDDYVEQIRRDREQTSADDSEDTDDKGDKNQRQTTTTTKQEEEGGLSEQAATLKVS